MRGVLYARPDPRKAQCARGLITAAGGAGDFISPAGLNAGITDAVIFVDRARGTQEINGELVMSVGTILIILLVIFLLGGFSGRFGGYGYGFGHGGVGIPGALLLIVVVLMLMGRI